MQYKAVIFDLFETLITEWGHKKYTKNELCADLNVSREDFDVQVMVAVMNYSVPKMPE